MDRSRGTGNLGGRIILLGDGTELNSDSADSEMFDHDEEDRDLDAQVFRGQAKENDKGSDSGYSTDARQQREDTPAPSSAPNDQTPSQKASDSNNDSPSSVATEKSEGTSASGQIPSGNANHAEGGKHDAGKSTINSETPEEPKMLAATDSTLPSKLANEVKEK